MKCPRCDYLLRAMDSKIIEEDDKKYRIIKLYCLRKGCANNNGQPVHEIRVEEKDDGTE